MNFNVDNLIFASFNQYLRKRKFKCILDKTFEIFIEIYKKTEQNRRKIIRIIFLKRDMTHSAIA